MCQFLTKLLPLWQCQKAAVPTFKCSPCRIPGSQGCWGGTARRRNATAKTKCISLLVLYCNISLFEVKKVCSNHISVFLFLEGDSKEFFFTFVYGRSQITNLTGVPCAKSDYSPPALVCWFAVVLVLFLWVLVTKSTLNTSVSAVAAQFETGEIPPLDVPAQPEQLSQHSHYSVPATQMGCVSPSNSQTTAITPSTAWSPSQGQFG